MIGKKVVVNQSGFSLIEVMIVIVITGVIIAVVLPDFNKIIGRYTLECATRELAAEIRILQQNAIKNESAGFYMQFNDVMDSYCLINTDIGVDPYKTTKLPTGVDLTHTSFKQTNQNRLLFAANGNPYNGFGGHITLRDRATGVSRYVIIDSVGRVRVSETRPE